MYKVFFNEHQIILTDLKNIENKCYKFSSKTDISLIINLLEKIKEPTTIYYYHKDLKKLWEKFKEKFEEICAAGGKVINNEDKILMIYRLGKWDLPKGKTEKDESIEETAVREVEEECGITNLKLIKPLQKTYHIYFIKERMILKTSHWFLMKYNKNEELKPQIEEGIEQVVWKSQDEIEELKKNMYSTIKELV